MDAAGEMVCLPTELAAGVDASVKADERDNFVTRAVARAIAISRMQVLDAAERRAGLLELLKDRTPILKDEDHPEFADGTEAYVRRLRAEWQPREEAAEAAWSSD